MAKPLAVNESDFGKVVLQSKTPVIVDFWAQTCPPCRAVAPIIDDLAAEYGARVLFAKVNVDGNSALATRYNVSSIPTILAFSGGKPLKQVVGLKSRTELKSFVDSLLGS